MGKLDTFLIELDKAEANDAGQRAALDRFHEAVKAEAQAVAQRLKQAVQGAGNFTPHELLFAAQFRCICGAGMAYPDGIGVHGAWHCSAILLGEAAPGTEHTPAHPFAFYEIKSEGQPSEIGATTRPCAHTLRRNRLMRVTTVGIQAHCDATERERRNAPAKTLCAQNAQLAISTTTEAVIRR